MKPAVCAFVALAISGCAGTSTPTSPSQLTSSASTGNGSAIPAKAFVWGFVVEPNGRCVENAVIEVTSGQGQGQRLVQTTPCDAWSYSDGFEFKDLTPGMSMTLRASAPGWTTAEKTVIPTAGGGPPLLIELQKL